MATTTIINSDSDNSDSLNYLNFGGYNVMNSTSK